MIYLDKQLSSLCLPTSDEIYRFPFAHYLLVSYLSDIRNQLKSFYRSVFIGEEIFSVNGFISAIN